MDPFNKNEQTKASEADGEVPEVDGEVPEADGEASETDSDSTEIYDVADEHEFTEAEDVLYIQGGLSLVYQSRVIQAIKQQDFEWATTLIINHLVSFDANNFEEQWFYQTVAQAYDEEKFCQFKREFDNFIQAFEASPKKNYDELILKISTYILYLLPVWRMPLLELAQQKELEQLKILEKIAGLNSCLELMNKHHLFGSFINWCITFLYRDINQLATFLVVLNEKDDECETILEIRQLIAKVKGFAAHIHQGTIEVNNLIDPLSFAARSFVSGTYQQTVEGLRSFFNRYRQTTINFDRERQVYRSALSDLNKFLHLLPKLIMSSPFKTVPQKNSFYLDIFYWLQEKYNQEKMKEDGFLFCGLLLMIMIDYDQEDIHKVQMLRFCIAVIEDFSLHEQFPEYLSLIFRLVHLQHKLRIDNSQELVLLPRVQEPVTVLPQEQALPTAVTPPKEQQKSVESTWLTECTAEVRQDIIGAILEGDFKYAAEKIHLHAMHYSLAEDQILPLSSLAKEGLFQGDIEKFGKEFNQYLKRISAEGVKDRDELMVKLITCFLYLMSTARNIDDYLKVQAEINGANIKINLNMDLFMSFFNAVKEHQVYIHFVTTGAVLLLEEFKKLKSFAGTFVSKSEISELSRLIKAIERFVNLSNERENEVRALYAAHAKNDILLKDCCNRSLLRLTVAFLAGYEETTLTFNREFVILRRALLNLSELVAGPRFLLATILPLILEDTNDIKKMLEVTFSEDGLQLFQTGVIGVLNSFNLPSNEQAELMLQLLKKALGRKADDIHELQWRSIPPVYQINFEYLTEYDIETFYAALCSLRRIALNKDISPVKVEVCQLLFSYLLLFKDDKKARHEVVMFLIMFIEKYNMDKTQYGYLLLEKMRDAFLNDMASFLNESIIPGLEWTVDAKHHEVCLQMDKTKINIQIMKKNWSACCAKMKVTLRSLNAQCFGVENIHLIDEEVLAKLKQATNSFGQTAVMIVKTPAAKKISVRVEPNTDAKKPAKLTPESTNTDSGSLQHTLHALRLKEFELQAEKNKSKKQQKKQKELERRNKAKAKSMMTSAVSTVHEEELKPTNGISEPVVAVRTPAAKKTPADKRIPTTTPEKALVLAVPSQEKANGVSKPIVAARTPAAKKTPGHKRIPTTTPEKALVLAVPSQKKANGVSKPIVAPITPATKKTPAHKRISKTTPPTTPEKALALAAPSQDKAFVKIKHKRKERNKPHIENSTASILHALPATPILTKQEDGSSIGPQRVRDIAVEPVATPAAILPLVPSLPVITPVAGLHHQEDVSAVMPAPSVALPCQVNVPWARDLPAQQILPAEGFSLFSDHMYGFGTSRGNR